MNSINIHVPLTLRTEQIFFSINGADVHKLTSLRPYVSIFVQMITKVRG